MGILVQATARGFFGKLREKGDKFEIQDKEQLGNWMLRVKDEPVEGDGKPAKAPAPAPAAKTTGKQPPAGSDIA